ncbi:hypothetical protein LTS18_008110, partial [Coniosporium uncinatum]
MALTAPFRVGGKQVFLPNFEIILMRTPKLSPYQAKFEVPLDFNKLDLRDYLWSAYNVHALTVRSFIQQSKVRQDKASSTRPIARRWHRPRSRKFMTIEMERPFIWPEEPENFDLWDKETYQAANSDREEGEGSHAPDAIFRRPRDSRSIAAQAKALLEGKERWRDEWEEEKEV